MDKNIMRKLFLIFLSIITFLIVNSETFAANYPLEIINIKPAGTGSPPIPSSNRIFKAYPGLEYNIRAAVVGGLYPYTYSLSNAPTGMIINQNTGEISWSNPNTSQSGANPTIIVRDSENTTTNASWTISVTTAGFYFVDDVNGTHADGFGCTNPGCGTGTLTNPWKSMIDWYRGTDSSAGNDATYQGGIVYWRAGTYALEGVCGNSGVQGERLYMNRGKPTIWIAYPGESVTIDQKENGVGNCTSYGGWINWGDSNDSQNIYIDGITFMNGRNHAHKVSIGWDYTTFRRSTFRDIGPGREGLNSAAILTVDGGSFLCDYCVWQDNKIYDINAVVAYKFYSINKNLIEDNTIHDQTPFDNTGGGLAMKEAIYNTTVRGNKLYNIYRRVINGNMNGLNNVEILYNLVYNTGPVGGCTGCGTALEFNNFSNATNMYIYRNTFVGRIRAESVDSSDGPFYFNNNVIVNPDSGTPAGSHIYHDYSTDPSRVILNNNLVGDPSDNIVDSIGNLTSAYSSYLGTHGYQTSGWTPPPSPPTNLTIQVIP